jgi:PAS domain S-box-containing protein
MNFPIYDSEREHCNQLLDQPALPEISDLAELAQRLFDTPIAFLAMLDQTEKVSACIGNGKEWWRVIEGFPLYAAFDDALIVPDIERWLPENSGSGGLGFLVAAPVRGHNGLPLGLLILADHTPRAEFSDADRKSLRTMLTAFTTDLELRALASQTLQSAMEVAEAEKRFRAIANCAPVLIIYGGADAAVTFVNSRWLEFTGRSAQEELGDGWSDSIHPEYRRSARHAFERAFEQRAPFTFEFPMLRNDGAYRWMRVHGTPRFLENGTFMGYVGCLEDFTDYRDALAEIERLKTANRAACLVGG